MRVWKRLLRALRVSTITLLSLILLAFLFVQFNQYLLRYRAKHLLADFQSLRLKQSNWKDAQRLMSRWGAFGHYDGTCSAADCSYFITLEDVGSKINLGLYGFMEARWPQGYSGITFFRIYSLLGGRGARMRLGFLVENGLVERNSVAVQVDTPLDKLWCDTDCLGGYAIILSARASQSLREKQDGPWIPGDEEQLALHPDYKVGRPGCEGCIAGEVTFTPYASQQEIATLTSYNLNCLTRHFHPCRTLPDILPIARDWRFYPTLEGVPEWPDPSGPPKPCDTPIFALGRDATSVLQVKVLSVGAGKDAPDYMYTSGRDFETAKLQIMSSLKGESSWPVNVTIDATPYAWDVNFPWEAAEHLQAGKTFIVMPGESSDKTNLSMPRCGVLADSPEVRRQLQRGFQQNDVLRPKERSERVLW